MGGQGGSDLVYCIGIYYTTALTRPLRIEFAGAVYHLTSRGNARQDIFLDDDDREGFLEILTHVIERYGWICYAYCLMGNHYHLLIETPGANLSRGMQLLNGVYTQRFNHKHKRVGHLFQGRFKAILAEKDSHLLELARYIVLNPVRAKIVRHPRQYRWSSYRATVGEAKSPGFLTVDWILTQFDQDLAHGRVAYRQFVKEGRGVPVWDDVKGGFLLGTEEFVGRMKPLLRGEEAGSEISKRQRFADRRSLEDLFAGVEGGRHMRDKRIHEAVMEHGYTLTALQKYLGLHPSTLSRIVKRIGEEKDARNKV